MTENATHGGISPGAALSALRKDRVLVCAHCGASFTAKDSRAKFCSNRCRQAAKYARLKAAKALCSLEDPQEIKT